MEPKTAKAIAELHYQLQNAYMEAANAACEGRQPYEVWAHVQSAHAEAAKARKIKQRWASNA